MTPVCSAINFSSSSLDWLTEMVLGSNYDHSITSFPWQIQTKYYRASVSLEIIQCEDVLNGETASASFSSTEAVVFYCDATKDVMALVDKAWERLKEAMPAVCLLVVESARDSNLEPGQISRTEILDWCLQHHFELVECDEGQDKSEESDDEDGIEEQLGRARVVEALKAHTWSNLELVEGGTGRKAGSGRLEDDGDSDSEEEESTRSIGEQVESVLAAAEDEEDDFGALFSQLASMRDQAATLQSQDRKAYAEQVAIAFYKAIGGQEE